MDQQQRHLLTLVSFLFIGLLGGYYLNQYFHPQKQFTEVRQNAPALHFTNPLLFYTSSPDSEYDSLKRDVSNYISNAKNKGDATDISVYFRDMNSGGWTGINENDTYEPASMLKVTAMIAYLNGSTENPSILDKKLYYTQTANQETYYTQKKIPSGYYSVRTLLNWMIVTSDNDAVTALEADDQDRTARVFSELQLSLPDGKSTDFMSARNYSRLFRVLYDSTYLPPSLSEQTLSMLSETTFTQGLVSGVPTGTVVSHKFGERTLVNETGAVTHRELHDCGIIYKADHPYFLCVMTKGADFTKLQKIISDISALTYTKY
jgi:Beta-lactamase enzyme family